MYPIDTCPVCRGPTTKIVWDTKYQKNCYQYECRSDEASHIYVHHSHNLIDLFYPNYWIATIEGSFLYPHKIRNRTDCETVLETDDPIPFLPNEEAIKFYVENYHIIK